MTDLSEMNVQPAGFQSIKILPKSGLLPHDHEVPDLLQTGLRLVFCGTALGRRSAVERAYYAHPGNMFWRVLHEAGLTPGRIAPQNYAQLLTHGIGLTDLAKGHFGNDGELPGEAFDVAGLREKIGHYRPGILAFTSKTAASVFLGRGTGQIMPGLQEQKVADTRLFVLPSPSGFARRYWTLAPWQELARLVNENHRT